MGVDHHHLKSCCDAQSVVALAAAILAGSSQLVQKWAKKWVELRWVE